MTKLRVAGSFEDAALDAVRILGAKEAAAASNLSPKTVRDYTDPDRPGQPSLNKALLIDAACHVKTGRAPFLEAYTRLLAARTEQQPGAIGEVPTEALDVPGAVRRLLDVIRRSTAAAAPGGGKLSSNEAAQILQEIKAPQRELDDLEVAVVEAANDELKTVRKTSA